MRSAFPTPPTPLVGPACACALYRHNMSCLPKHCGKDLSRTCKACPNFAMRRGHAHCKIGRRRGRWGTCAPLPRHHHKYVQSRKPRRHTRNTCAICPESRVVSDTIEYNTWVEGSGVAEAAPAPGRSGRTRCLFSRLPEALLAHSHAHRPGSIAAALRQNLQQLLFGESPPGSCGMWLTFDIRSSTSSRRW
jgi:hypothetical protein